MKSVETHLTPPHVVDAIQTVAAWLREIDAAEALISPAGGAAFHPTRKADELLAGWQQDRAAFATVLTTIGGAIYTRSRGAKWEQDLLAFVRAEREKLTF